MSGLAKFDGNALCNKTASRKDLRMQGDVCRFFPWSLIFEQVFYDISAGARRDTTAELMRQHRVSRVVGFHILQCHQRHFQQVAAGYVFDPIDFEPGQ